MFGLGWPEMLGIMLFALLIFGSAKLPEIGRSLGKSLREFKKAMQETEDEQDKEKRSGDESGKV
jgi:sec-independent protein translocase protein TatA